MISFLSIIYIKIYLMSVLYLTRLKVSKSVLLSVDIKNISSINLRYINENALKNGYTGFLSRWSINMFVYEGAKIVPIVQSFICK